MGVRDTGPFDVAFDELVPAVVRDLHVIRAAGSEVNYIFHTGLPGTVYECFALAQHIDRIAGHYKDAVDPFPGRALWFHCDHSQTAPRESQARRPFRATARPQLLQQKCPLSTA
jgi:hypothetical protein